MAQPVVGAGLPVPENLASAIALTQKAHQEESEGNHNKSFDLHGQAAELLQQFIKGSKSKTEIRRRAKLQLRAANERMVLLKACFVPDPATGQLAPPPPILPSIMTLPKELIDPSLGIVPLTLVEQGALASLPLTVSVSINNGNPTMGQKPHLTPLLDAHLPDLTYHVYIERYQRFPNMTWINLHFKDAEKKQIMYTVSALKRQRYQIPTCIMFRASEYHTPCASVAVQGIRDTRGEHRSEMTGRPLTITTALGSATVDSPDRERKFWTPSRFTYGGAKFVWKQGPNTGMVMGNELFEVKNEWAKEGSKTGKVEDETFARRLVWGETKFALSKVGVLHMVGGLDQVFREFLLANVAAKTIVSRHGHDRRR